MAGRKPISEEIKAQVMDLLQKGEFTIPDIADECGISVRSVKTIKKEMPDGIQASQETVAALSRYTKTELKYIRKIEAEQALFEDEEEGWTYHITKAQSKKLSASVWWIGIAYPESVVEHWVEKLRNIGAELAISPLHDKDVWSHDSPARIDEDTGEVIEELGSRYRAGERKKAHWHFILKFPRKVGFRDVNNLIRPITCGPYLQKCYALKGAYEYFIHLNHPERYQYDKSEIQKYNNFIVEPTRSDMMYMLQDILETIRNNEFDTLTAVVDFYIEMPECLYAIKNGAYMVQKLIDENWRKHNPNYARKVMLVEDNDGE